MRKKLIGLTAAGVVAIALPLHAAALNINFTAVPSTLVHNTDSYVTTDFDTDVSKTLSSQETVLQLDEHIYHHGDTGTPADNTKIGTAWAAAFWISNFCASRSQQNFDVYWINPDGGYTPPSGWTVVAETQVKSNSSLFTVTFDGYVIENSTGAQKVEVPSYPNLACTNNGSTENHIHQVLGLVGTTQYKVHRNPSTVGTFTDTTTVKYSNGTTDSGSYSYTTT